MVRRSALDAVGPYDERFIFEDYDMWLRLADRFEVRCLPVIVGNYRILDSEHVERPAQPHAPGAGQHGHPAEVAGPQPADRCGHRGGDPAQGPLGRVWNRDATVEALRAVQHVDDSRRWAAATALLALPGADRAMAGIRIARERARQARH